MGSGMTGEGQRAEWVIAETMEGRIYFGRLSSIQGDAKYATCDMHDAIEYMGLPTKGRAMILASLGEPSAVSPRVLRMSVTRVILIASVNPEAWRAYIPGGNPDA